MKMVDCTYTYYYNLYKYMLALPSFNDIKIMYNVINYRIKYHKKISFE